MTPQEAAQLYARVLVYWPHNAVRHDDQKLQAQAWAEAMPDIRYAEAVAAVIECTRRGDVFPPAVSLIVELALDLRDEADGTKAPDTDQAVEWIMNQVRRRGFSQGPPETWPHPALRDAVRAVTWRDLCHSEQPGVVRAHLIKMYEAARERTTRERRRAPIAAALIEAKRAELGRARPGLPPAAE